MFGNGRTAVKASIGRYNQLSRSDLTRRFHPFSSSVNAAFRTWTDSNSNYIPDCDVQNFAAQDLSGSGGDICGAISNPNFGKFIPSSTVFDDSVTKDNRDFLWDINVDFQHEITHGLSVNVAYNHNWDGNFTVTQRIGLDGQPLGPEAYDEFCITVPNDSRLRDVRPAAVRLLRHQAGIVRPGHAARDQCQGVRRASTATPSCRSATGTASRFGMNGRLPVQRRASAAVSTSAATSTTTASRWTCRTSRWTSPVRTVSIPRWNSLNSTG